jgi:hypothetical protein
VNFQVDTGYTCVVECNQDEENYETKCFEKCEPFIVMDVSGEPWLSGAIDNDPPPLFSFFFGMNASRLQIFWSGVSRQLVSPCTVAR